MKDVVSTLASKLFKQDKTKTTLCKDEINSIVIIRPNYRIGNLLLLTPLINELHNTLPHAKIDIIVGMKLAGEILQEMPNVNKVIDIPRKLLLHPLELYRFIKQARNKKYDLAINIVAGSASSQIVTILTNSKYKASHSSEQNFTPLTHCIEYENLYTHFGSEPLEFLKLFEVSLPKKNMPLDIKLSAKEKELAQNDLSELLQRENIPSHFKTVALFRNARFEKKIPDEWWNEWYKELRNLDTNLIVIDILSPDIPQKLNTEFLEYSNKNLRALSAFFSVCDLYVSADTGPMHLASAANAKMLALFNKTEISRYGVLNEKGKTVDINELSPKDVAQISYEHLHTDL
jgi:ADP-heptose:LPS heptosyltransferase